MAKLIAVIGHTKCGAIKGACGQVQLGHLTDLLAKVGPAITRAAETEKGLARTDPQFIEKVAVLNVQTTIKEIRERSPILREMIDKGQIALVGGMYHLDTGEVEFLPN